MKLVVWRGKRVLSAVLVVVLLVGLGAVGAAQGREPVHLTIWTVWTNVRTPLLLEVLDEFMKEYPWITVEHNLVSNSARWDRFVVSTAGGSPPDVMMLGREEIPVAADQGLVIPLDEFMARDGITHDIFFPGEIGPAIWEGKTYILPMPTGGAANNLLYYNKRLFREAGLDDTSAPETWDQLLAVSKRLTRKGLDGEILQAAFRPQTLTYRRFFAWAFSNGGTYATEDGRTLLFNSEKNHEALQWLVDFNIEVYGSPGFSGFDADQFYDETVAMRLDGSWRLYQITTANPNIDLGVGLIPHNEGYESLGVSEGGWGYVIPAGVPHPEESWLLLKWLTTSDKGGRWFVFEQMRPSPVIEFSLDQRYFDANPHWNTVIQALQTSVPLPQTFIEPQLKTMENSFLNRAFGGRENPRVVLDEYQRVAQQMLDDYLASRAKE